jgi:hypothetical protein
MREMRDALSGLPGCTAVEPPYLTDDGTCLVGISKWESRQAFFASGLTLRPPDEIVEGETKPRQRLLLEEPDPCGPATEENDSFPAPQGPHAGYPDDRNPAYGRHLH